MKCSFTILFFVFCFSISIDKKNANSVEGDRQALMDLYEATGGSGWSNDSGWGSGNPSGNWHGINVNSQGRVIRVDLSDNNLAGSLPESIGNLSKVKYFNVKQNNMSGQIPTSIGHMISLTHLLLNGRAEDPGPRGSHHPGKAGGGSWSDERTNSFGGSIPESIGNLRDLQYFECTGQGNKDIDDGTGYPDGLTGLPESIGNLTNLIGLHLDFNNISSLPSSMSNLTNLVHLSIGRNALNGHGLPSWVGNLTNLRYLWIKKNRLGGEVPDLSNLTDLRIISSSFNDFKGPFPDYLIDGTMPDINLIEIAFNELTGRLPTIGENNLAMLGLGWNNLEGELPDLSNLTSMVNLGLDQNNFSGEIPDLSHMSRLRYLRANDNNFTGPVPMVDTNNEKLNFLYFQNNQMSGKVPQELANIADLPRIDNNDLNLADNEFSNSDLDPLIDALKSDGNLDVLNY